MYKVGIIGPESCGKTTLARYLAKHYNGVFIPEYGREYMEQRLLQTKNTNYTYDDVCNIARQQISVLQSYHQHNTNEILFFDTELIVTKVWFEHRYQSCPNWLQDALIQYPMDVYLLCSPDIQWKDDPVRENANNDIRWDLFKWYEKEIQNLNIPYYIVQHLE